MVMYLLSRFTRSYPFPSFNVQDLHTVDRGVQERLLPEVKGGDYSLLIAHFLGVDHCGHRYGPDHPAMADKLAEMDAVIRYSLSNYIPCFSYIRMFYFRK